MLNFIRNLLIQLANFQDETVWLSYDVLKDMIIQAANQAIGDRPLSNITLHREVSPEDMQVWSILKIDGAYLTSLDAADIATLRALLLTWDETRPPQVGDPLSVPTRLRDGRVVTEVTGELLVE